MKNDAPAESKAKAPDQGSRTAGLGILSVFVSGSFPASSTGRLLVLGGICAVTFFLRSGALPFLGADEPRYAQIAEEMRASGDWVLPHLQGKPWLEKPPLYYWLTAACFSLFGSGEAQARLVSAFSIVLLTATLYFFGKSWFSAESGWIAALIFSGSAAATGFSRAASMDALFSGLLFLGICCFGQALFTEREPLRWLFSALAGISLGLSVLAKGLLGLALPAVVLVLFLVWTGTWGRIPWRPLLLGAVLVPAVSLPWHWMAFQRDGFDFLAIYLVNHHLARFFTEIHHHTQPFYYYLIVLPACLLPWTPLLGVLALRRDRLPKQAAAADAVPAQARMLLAILAVFLTGFFSLSASKLPGYILPACPPLALLMAAGWEGVKNGAQNAVRMKRLLAGCGFLALVLGPVFAVLLHRIYELPWPAAAGCGGAYLLGGGGLLYRLYRDPGKAPGSGSFLILVLAHALLVVQLSFWAFSPIGLRHSTRDLAQAALTRQEAGELFFSYRSFHHTLAFYSRGLWQGNLENPEQLAARLAAIPGAPLLLMTERKWLPELVRTSRRPVRTLGEYGPRILVRLQP